jgi:hypothetical protein
MWPSDGEASEDLEGNRDTLSLKTAGVPKIAREGRELSPDMEGKTPGGLRGTGYSNRQVSVIATAGGR